MEFHFSFQVFLSLALVVILGLIFRVYSALVTKPRRLRHALRQQGIGGPPSTFLLGNISDIRRARISAPEVGAATPSPPFFHNCGPALFPSFYEWRKQYGEIFMFSLGNIQLLHVNQYDMVREITTCTSLDLGKPKYQAKEFHSLLGDGILTSNGNFWAHQRKILAPQLFMDKVKGMISLIQQSTVILINSWKDVIDAEGGVTADIKIDNYLKKFSGDVISRACFGSSYSEGEHIFQKLRDLEKISSKKVLSTGIPCMSYIPTHNNRRAWELKKDIKALILKLVNQKNEAKSENNLMQRVVEEAESVDFIVDNCKNIYLAGYETTAIAATWCLMLLASNQEWQDRVRAEVLEICNGRIPDSDSIKKMKQLTMVINESLRLYPPVAVVSREALKDLKFGNTYIPKGVNIWIMVTSLHTDPDIWGQDSYEFKPERFSNGISGACKLPHLYMPFGIGPRICLGMNLAMVELKILLSLVLSDFSLSLSPKYVHAPALRLVIEPENGVDLVMERLNSPVIA
ncbi:hypothetical protein ABFS83_14G316600 [Erythranthe nasuta]